MPRWFAPTAVLFLLCFGTGFLSWQASIPSRWLFAIFPPAGIALAGLTIYGRAYWPAAIGGTTLIFFFAAWDRHHAKGPIEEIALYALIVGALYAAQTFTGLFLLRRWLSSPLELTRPRDIAVFLLVAGPLQTIIPGLIGSQVPVLFGFLNPEFVWSRVFGWCLNEISGGSPSA